MRIFYWEKRSEFRHLIYMIFVVLYLESDLSIEIDKFNRKCCLIWFSSVSQPAKFLSQISIWNLKWLRGVLSRRFIRKDISEGKLHTPGSFASIYNINTLHTVVFIKLITAENWKHCRNLDCLSISYWLWRISSLCRVAGGGRPSVSAVVRTELNSLSPASDTTTAP